MKTWKVCVVTSSRADYGLLYWTIKRLHDEPSFELQLVATGTHLSPEFGLTRGHILNDGFKIDKEVEILLASDSPAAVSKAMGLACIGFADAFSSLNPDLVFVLGDRFEILAVTQTAFVANIPVAHCHGGELTEGAIDDAFRHAITKMAQLHFTSTNDYRRRVIQLGEDPGRVFNVGALGIESIKHLTLLDKAAFEKSIGFKLHARNLLITYHPVTLQKHAGHSDVSGLFDALNTFQNTGFIFTMPNADSDGRQIWDAIVTFVARNSDRAVCFKNLGHMRYLSALQHVDAVVGNSSSGIIEAPSFHVGTVNIGPRQEGRVRAASVIDCNPTKIDIADAITMAFSDAFRKKLNGMKNPYDNGDSSLRILDVIREFLAKGFSRKRFYDIDFEETPDSTK